jgi:ammonia channel protein AmtB
VNTLLALISGAVSAYVISAFLNQNRFLIFDIARSTIAGGVAISSIANMLVSPSVAMIIGVVRVSKRNIVVLFPIIESDNSL